MLCTLPPTMSSSGYKPHAHVHVHVHVHLLLVDPFFCALSTLNLMKSIDVVSGHIYGGAN